MPEVGRAPSTCARRLYSRGQKVGSPPLCNAHGYEKRTVRTPATTTIKEPASRVPLSLEIRSPRWLRGCCCFFSGLRCVTSSCSMVVTLVSRHARQQQLCSRWAIMTSYDARRAAGRGPALWGVAGGSFAVPYILLEFLDDHRQRGRLVSASKGAAAAARPQTQRPSCPSSPVSTC